MTRDRSPVSSGSYAATFYPGSENISGASLVEVRPGEEVQRINVVLPRLPTFQIRGHVLDTAGKPPKRPMIGVMPMDPDYVSASSMSVSAYCGDFDKCNNPDGRFQENIGSLSAACRLTSS